MKIQYTYINQANATKFGKGVSMSGKFTISVIIIVIAAAAIVTAVNFSGKARVCRWADELKDADVASIEFRVGSASANALSDEEKVEMVSLINKLDRKCFTENKHLAGTTAEFGSVINMVTGESFTLNEAPSPHGMLELEYGGKQWWIDNDPLYAFLEERYERMQSN